MLLWLTCVEKFIMAVWIWCMASLWVVCSVLKSIAWTQSDRKRQFGLFQPVTAFRAAHCVGMETSGGRGIAVFDQGTKQPPFSSYSPSHRLATAPRPHKKKHRWHSCTLQKIVTVNNDLVCERANVLNNTLNIFFPGGGGKLKSWGGQIRLSSFLSMPFHFLSAISQ